jgi:hypothetical protein
LDPKQRIVMKTARWNLSKTNIALSCGQCSRMLVKARDFRKFKVFALGCIGSPKRNAEARVHVFVVAQAIIALHWLAGNIRINIFLE